MLQKKEYILATLFVHGGKGEVLCMFPIGIPPGTVTGHSS